jgi:uncharacterized protein
MKYLFFFVHPSKFHVFRNTINHLISNGHQVDLLIIKKDVLEDLVKLEGWKYTNLFPGGRKIKGVSPYISSGFNFFSTIFKLYRYTKGKQHDVYITDDLLVYIGKLKKVPTFTFIDSDLVAVRQFALVLKFTDYILAPAVTDLGRFNNKKVSFNSYKELAYLHPNHFSPDIEVVKSFNPGLQPYFILRLVNLGAYHDVGMKGLPDSKVRQLISLLETKGKVYISSERKLPTEFEKYRLKISPLNIAHALYFAEIYVGDSQTMSSEAAVLGTPTFRCNDFVGKLSVMEEKETKYHLSFNFPPSDFNRMLQMIKSLLEMPDYKEEFQKRRFEMLKEKIDLSSFLDWLLEGFPKSVEVIMNTPEYQDRFIGVKAD